MENIPSNFKFLFYKTKDAFERDLSKQRIKDTSIVFIQGAAQNDRAIWTHHTYFSVSEGLEHSKGVFETLSGLKRNVPWPLVGDWAIVLNAGLFPATFPIEFNTGDGWMIYTCQTEGVWTQTDKYYNKENINLSEYIKKEDVNFGEYWRKDELDLSPYLTTSNADLLYAKLSAVNTLNNNINTIAEQLAKYAKKSELNSYATRESLLSYLKIEDIPTYIQTTSSGDVVDLSNFYTKSQIDSKLQNIDLSEIQNEISALRDAINNLNTQTDCNCPKHVFLTQAQYDALEEYDNDTLYFITGGWMFGNSFPVILT